MAKENEVPPCAADDCPNRGKHVQHLISWGDAILGATQPSEDYAVRAAREWLADIKHQWTKTDEDELAAIIRKHVGAEKLSCGCNFATPDCKAR